MSPEWMVAQNRFNCISSVWQVESISDKVQECMRKINSLQLDDITETQKTEYKKRKLVQEMYVQNISKQMVVDQICEKVFVVIMSPPCKGWETYCISPCVCVSVCLSVTNRVRSIT